MSEKDAVIDPINKLMSAVWNNPRALLNMTRTLLISRGKAEQIVASLDRAIELAPDDPEIQAMSTSITSRLVESWYFSMVQDATRHELYSAALQRIVTPNTIVLDIGSGTGLFAMIAARAGAKLVVGCEKNPIVARAAQDVIRENGLEGRVRIVPKSMSDLIVGEDLPSLADIVLWDNLANNLVGAGCLPVLADAQRRLAREGAIMVPSRIEVKVALVEDLQPLERSMDEAAGFDLTAFNRFRKSRVVIKRNQFELRSDPATIFELNLADEQSATHAARLVTVRATGGRVTGVVQWLRFHLVDGIVYDTSGPDVTAFGHQFHHVPGFLTQSGQMVTIGGNGNGQDDWFWIQSH